MYSNLALKRRLQSTGVGEIGDGATQFIGAGHLIVEAAAGELIVLLLSLDPHSRALEFGAQRPQLGVGVVDPGSDPSAVIQKAAGGGEPFVAGCFDSMPVRPPIEKIPGEIDADVTAIGIGEAVSVEREGVPLTLPRRGDADRGIVSALGQTDLRVVDTQQSLQGAQVSPAAIGPLFERSGGGDCRQGDRPVEPIHPNPGEIGELIEQLFPAGAGLRNRRFHIVDPSLDVVEVRRGDQPVFVEPLGLFQSGKGRLFRFHKRPQGRLGRFDRSVELCRLQKEVALRIQDFEPGTLSLQAAAVDLGTDRKARKERVAKLQLPDKVTGSPHRYGLSRTG